MAENPALFVRVSTEDGHHTMPAASAEGAGSGFRVLKQDALDKSGRPLPFKPREDTLAATETPEPETVSGDDTEESE